MDIYREGSTAYKIFKRGFIGGLKADRKRSVYHLEEMGSDGRLHVFMSCPSCGEVNDVEDNVKSNGCGYEGFYCNACNEGCMFKLDELTVEETNRINGR